MAAAVSIIGGIFSFMGQQQQAKAAAKAERAREQQMNLDAMRKRRAALRESLLARQVALANATNQGAAAGSGLPGGYGQIQGIAGQNIQGITQDQQLGQQIFAANRQYAAGGAMMGFGSMLGDMSGTIGRISGAGGGFGFGTLMGTPS